MSKHTPGPWVVEAGKFEGYVIRESGVENPINPGTGWRFVVDPIDGDSKAHKRVHIGAIPREDEAHLIAAAPDLLEALERVKATGVFLGAITQEMVDAAIAKAKGERECAEQGKLIQSQTVTNASDEYNSGRKMGIEVFMNTIRKHFGVEE